jgi:hypothetical protein
MCGNQTLNFELFVFLYYMLLFVFLLLHMYCVREYNKKFKVMSGNRTMHFIHHRRW